MYVYLRIFIPALQSIHTWIKGWHADFLLCTSQGLATKVSILLGMVSLHINLSKKQSFSKYAQADKLLFALIPTYSTCPQNSWAWTEMTRHLLTPNSRPPTILQTPRLR